MSFVEIIEKLKKEGKTVSTMESCTGGGVANSITNIEGASSVFCFGAVTYSNAFKIKMGVDAEVIEKYSVYSMETADEMSQKISFFTESDYGIGITGKFNKADPNNLSGDDHTVFVSIYDREKDLFFNQKVVVLETSREENKKQVIDTVILLLLKALS